MVNYVVNNNAHCELCSEYNVMVNYVVNSNVYGELCSE